jgi:hypothetical protein
MLYSDNRRVKMNDELERIWKEDKLINLLNYHLAAGSGETSQSEWPASRPKFEPSTSRIRECIQKFPD